MRLDLRHLRYFVTVAEELQISRAARRLFIAQPALSQSVHQLERELGVELFHRHGRGVTLTEPGRLFLPKAREVLAAVDDAVATVRPSQTRVSAELAIGFLPPMIESAVHLVERFLSAHRWIVLRWQPHDFVTQESELRSGGVDLAFLWVPREDRQIGFLPIASEPRAVLLSARHPLAGRTALTLADVADEPFPAVQEGVPAEWADFWSLTDVRGHRPPAAGGAPLTVEQAWALVASGEAITAAPQSLARTYARAGVVARPLLDVPPAILAAAWRKQDARPEVEAFLQFASAPAASSNGSLRSDG